MPSKIYSDEYPTESDYYDGWLAGKKAGREEMKAEILTKIRAMVKDAPPSCRVFLEILIKEV